MLRPAFPRASIVLLVLCAAVAIPATGCGSGDAPIVVLPAKLDFGRVMLGQTRRFKFTLRNNGNRTVGFSARANCACLAVAQSLRPLDPGKELEFTVILATKTLSPKKITGKYVAIRTDHPDQGEIIVPAEGEVFRAYDIRPTKFDWHTMDGRPKNYEPRTVIVRPVAGQSVEYEGLIAMPDVFDAKAEPFGDRGLKVHLTLRKGVFRPIGRFNAQLRIRLKVTLQDGTVFRDEPIINVRGRWALKPPPRRRR